MTPQELAAALAALSPDQQQTVIEQVTPEARRTRLYAADQALRSAIGDGINRALAVVQAHEAQALADPASAPEAPSWSDVTAAFAGA